MNFSMIFPTRGRQNLLMNLLNSIKKTTKNVAEIEVLIAVDNDDIETLKLIPELKAKHTFVTFYEVERSENFSKDYYNFLAKQATGIYLIALNDDIEFKTEFWDQIIINKLTHYFHNARDKIVYAWLDDGYRHPQGFCCFPLITRQAYNALGWFFPEEFPTWGSDLELFYIFRHIDRVCKIPEVLLDHISPHTQKRSPDEQNKRVELLDRRMKYDYREPARRLRRAIRSYR